MIFTVTYREKDGAKAETVVEAASRAECVTKCKERGIAPMGIREGGAHGSGRALSAATNTAVPTGHKMPRAFAVCLVAAVGVLVAITLWVFERDTPQPPPGDPFVAVPKIKAANPSEAKPAKTRVVPVDMSTKPADQAPSPVATGEIWNGHKIASKRVVTNGVNIVTTRIGVDGKVYKQIEKANDKPIFNNPVDQALALMLTLPKGAMIPPMPPLGTDSDKVFLTAIKTPIEIRDEDTPEIKNVKRIVAAAREEILEQLASGRSVNEVIAEHCTSVNENTRLRAQATAEYRRILEEEGDVALAEEFREKSNQVLVNVGAVPIKKRGELRRTREP